MSILIKDMEMPKENRLTLQIGADGAVYVVNRCRITTETYTTDAVPVPPHGRLIDADKLIRNFQAMADNEWNKNCGATWSDGFLEAINMTEDAPTIIEADVTDINVGEME